MPAVQVLSQYYMRWKGCLCQCPTHVIKPEAMTTGACHEPLHSFNFLKCCWMLSFWRGAVARQVGKFSGCSIHSLCCMPVSWSFEARFSSCVSPLISNTTCTHTCTVWLLHPCYMRARSWCWHRPETPECAYLLKLHITRPAGC